MHPAAVFRLGRKSGKFTHLIFVFSRTPFPHAAVTGDVQRIWADPQAIEEWVVNREVQKTKSMEKRQKNMQNSVCRLVDVNCMACIISYTMHELSYYKCYTQY